MMRGLWGALGAGIVGWRTVFGARWAVFGVRQTPCDPVWTCFFLGNLGVTFWGWRFGEWMKLETRNGMP